MSLWAKAQQLPAESLQQIRATYGEHFPIEVRHYLAQYIEEKFCTDKELVSNNPQHEQYGTRLVNDLITEIEIKAVALTDTEYFLTKLKLADAAELVRKRYRGNPMMLVTYIQQCLATEMRLVQAASEECIPDLPFAPSTYVEVLHKINVLRSRTQSTAEDLRKMEQDQEALTLHYHDCKKINAHFQQLSAQASNPQTMPLLQNLQSQKDIFENTLAEKMAGLKQSRLAIEEKFRETIRFLTELQMHVLDEELARWKREQLAGNGANFNSNLDIIQEWCESLAHLIWLTKQKIQKADRLKQKLALDLPGVPNVLPQLLAEITGLLTILIPSTFIIETQPPQVLKTNTRFTATVRLLVGGKLNVHLTPPQVNVSIISEPQAIRLLKCNKLGKNGENSGVILNNSGTMEYQQATKQLSVGFRNMLLKRINRTVKKGAESVTDEKFALLFQSQFNVGGGEMLFHVWTISLPVVVIVHGTQEPHACATVTWDNAFCELGRVPFAVPEQVPWETVAEALSMKFRATTGRPLTEDNLKFLAEKAFRDNAIDTTNATLSWALFCKDPLREGCFTFWEWFYAAMKLTKEYLEGLWVDGAILGFVTKKQAEELLSACACGTFLLRFSDSQLGGITIAWISDGGDVFSLQPFTSKDFSIRSLADRVADLNSLVYLYPNISKNIPFGRYYTPYEGDKPANGYVKWCIKQVPDVVEGPSILNPSQSSSLLQNTSSITNRYSDTMDTLIMQMDSACCIHLDQLNEDRNSYSNFNDLISGYKQ